MLFAYRTKKQQFCGVASIFKFRHLGWTKNLHCINTLILNIVALIYDVHVFVQIVKRSRKDIKNLSHFSYLKL